MSDESFPMPESKSPKRLAIEALFKRALVEKPPLTPGNLRRFVRHDYPFLSRTTTEDYADALLVLIERYLDQKKSEKKESEPKSIE